MGLLKKRPPEDEEGVPGEPEAPAALTDTPASVPDTLTDAGLEAPAPTASVEDATAEEAAPVAAEAVAPSVGPAPDALLQMFEAAQHQGEDRSMFVQMAGDVELADLIEDLATTAAALGIVVARASTPYAVEGMAA